MNDFKTGALLCGTLCTLKTQRQWRWQPLTVSTKVAMGISSLFVITISILSALSLDSFKTNLKTVFLAQQSTLTGRIADELDRKLLTMQKALVSGAKTASAADLANAEDAQQFLDRNVGLHALFDRSTFLFSVSGKIIAEHPYLPNRRGQDFSWRDYIKDTLRSGKAIISQPFITTKDDHSLVLMLTAPIFSADGKMLGILSGSLDLTQPAMLGEIGKMLIGRSGYLYMVTAEGKLMAHPDPARLSQRAFAPDTNPLFEKALGGFEGAGESQGPDGKKLLVSYRRIASTGWIVAAVYPEEEAFLAFNTLVGECATVLIAACIIMLGAIWGFTHNSLASLDALLDQLQRANKALEKMRSDASGKLRARSTFFQEASHDFRQRLHAMQLLVHAARSKPADSSPVLFKLSDVVADLQTYVKHFLEFAKLEAAVITPQREKIHLQDIFQELELAFEDVAHDKKIDLRLRATTICLHTDEKMLLRILENLLSNAIKFTNTRVLLAARKRADGISIEVWDNGRGITTAEHEIVFEAFYQSSPYADPQQEGVGLGLSIVRRFAGYLNYTISIFSREGKGSVVKVFLPFEENRD
jgi:signal transduction histidine kinase